MALGMIGIDKAMNLFFAALVIGCLVAGLAGSVRFSPPERARSGAASARLWARTALDVLRSRRGQGVERNGRHDPGTD